MCIRTYLGFDPGGAGAFGWCLAQGTSLPLTVLALGTGNHAHDATDAALKATKQIKAQLTAVGIDAPLFWRPDGDRRVDRWIRQRIVSLGAPSGTVNAVNSLRGACIVQGMMAALILRTRHPGLPVTESHPKAMLWLACVSNKDNPPSRITLSELGQYFTGQLDGASDHERDAALGALSAWAMSTNATGWQNLYAQEHDPISPLEPAPGYWMPMSDTSSTSLRMKRPSNMLP